MWSRFKTSTQTFVRKKYPKFTIRNLMINIDKDNAGAKSADDVGQGRFDDSWHFLHEQVS